MALSIATASFAPSSAIPAAAQFANEPGATRVGLWNGAGISAFGGELAVPARLRSRRTIIAREEEASSVRSSMSESWGRSCTAPLRRKSTHGEGGQRRSVQVSVRAMAENQFDPTTVVESKGLSYDGPGQGGQWLSSTTRHVRLYIGVADPEAKTLDQTQLDKITLMLDPDNEFLWPEEQVQKVYDYFSELVEAYAGAPMTEYTLRLIGSDIEHYIRKLLLGNEIKYNLDCRVLNFSMGKPRYASGIVEETEE